MALTQGFRGLCPCPVCLVPHQDQQKLTEQYPLRTVNGTKTVMELIKSACTAADKEKILEENGIRAISVSSSLNPIFSATILNF